MAKVEVRSELEGEVRLLDGGDGFLLLNFSKVIQILCVHFRSQHPIRCFSLLQLLDDFLLSFSDAYIGVVGLKNPFQNPGLYNLTLHFCQLLSSLNILAHLNEEHCFEEVS